MAAEELPARMPPDEGVHLVDGAVVDGDGEPLVLEVQRQVLPHDGQAHESYLHDRLTVGRAREETTMQAWVLSLVVQSVAFSDGQAIPKQFTCDGADQSPRIEVSELPPSARSWVLIVDDPDAPGRTFAHWVVYNLPPAERSLGPAVPAGTLELASGARQGRNDFGKPGYGGPCPPAGKPHRYRFRALALDQRLDLPPRASAADVQRAASGHVIATGTLTATYGR
jgi:Raf kinase inhibitor-like YbhB/YbcL family protein